MKRVLVTGGSGFVGRHILTSLAQKGYEVHATTFRATLSPDLRQLPVSWHTCDLLNTQMAADIVKQVSPTHLLHGAWITEHGTYWTSPENLSWIASTAALLRAFSDVGGKRYVGVGSCAEYVWESSVYEEANTPEQPATFYGSAKLIAHKMAMAAAETLCFSSATGRIFFAYGPYENSNRILPYTCQKLARGEVAEISNGSLVRDFLHVRDVASGFAFLLDSDIKGAVNIASGEPQPLGHLATSLAQIAGRPDLIQIGNAAGSPGNPSEMIARIDLISSTGWKPQISIDQGLHETYEWWDQQRLGEATSEIL